MGLDIHAIILQLVSVSLPHDKLDRDEHIRNLRPINGVSTGLTPPHDPEFSFYVSKLKPTGHKFIFDDMMTVVASEELYPFYLELTQKEFTMRFNRTLFDHISSKLKKSRDRNVADEDNIWLQPNTAFVNWFDEHGIEIDSIESLMVEDNISLQSGEKEDQTDSLWSLADDLRYRKDDGKFTTYREAYRWGELHWTHNGNPIPAFKFERAYHKAKSEGKVD